MIIPASSRQIFYITFGSSAAAAALTVLIILIIRYQRNAVRFGSDGRAKAMIILPIYEPILWFIAVGYLVQTMLLGIPGPFPHVPDWFIGAMGPEEEQSKGVQVLNSFLYASYWFSFELMAEGFSLILLQRYPSRETFFVAFKYAAFFALFSAGITTIGFNGATIGFSGNTQRLIDIIFVSLPSPFYIALLFPGILRRFVGDRTSTSPYTIFALSWRLSCAIALGIGKYSTLVGASITLYRSFLSPLIMYLTLIFETNSWRRLADKTLKNLTTMATISNVMEGKSGSVPRRKRREPRRRYLNIVKSGLEDEEKLGESELRTFSGSGRNAQFLRILSNLADSVHPDKPGITDKSLGTFGIDLRLRISDPKQDGAGFVLSSAASRGSIDSEIRTVVDTSVPTSAPSSLEHSLASNGTSEAVVGRNPIFDDSVPDLVVSLVNLPLPCSCCVHECVSIPFDLLFVHDSTLPSPNINLNEPLASSPLSTPLGGVQAARTRLPMRETPSPSPPPLKGVEGTVQADENPIHIDAVITPSLHSKIRFSETASSPQEGGDRPAESESESERDDSDGEESFWRRKDERVAAQLLSLDELPDVISPLKSRGRLSLQLQPQVQPQGSPPAGELFAGSSYESPLVKSANNEILSYTPPPSRAVSSSSPSPALDSLWKSASVRLQARDVTEESKEDLSPLKRGPGTPQPAFEVQLSVWQGKEEDSAPSVQLESDPGSLQQQLQQQLRMLCPHSSQSQEFLQNSLGFRMLESDISVDASGTLFYAPRPLAHCGCACRLQASAAEYTKMHVPALPESGFSVSEELSLADRVLRVFGLARAPSSARSSARSHGSYDSYGSFGLDGQLDSERSAAAYDTALISFDSNATAEDASAAGTAEHDSSSSRESSLLLRGSNMGSRSIFSRIFGSSRKPGPSVSSDQIPTSFQREVISPPGGLVNPSQPSAASTSASSSSKDHLTLSLDSLPLPSRARAPSVISSRAELEALSSRLRAHSTSQGSGSGEALGLLGEGSESPGMNSQMNLLRLSIVDSMDAEFLLHPSLLQHERIAPDVSPRLAALGRSGSFSLSSLPSLTEKIRRTSGGSDGSLNLLPSSHNVHKQNSYQNGHSEGISQSPPPLHKEYGSLSHTYLPFEDKSKGNIVAQKITQFFSRFSNRGPSDAGSSGNNDKVSGRSGGNESAFNTSRPNSTNNTKQEQILFKSAKDYFGEESCDAYAGSDSDRDLDFDSDTDSSDSDPIAQHGHRYSSIQNFRDSNQRYLVDFSNLEVGPVIDRGGTSVVRMGRYRGKLVALKQFIPQEINEGVIGFFYKENLFSAMFSHPCIVRYHGLCVSPPQISLVFELCERGSLYNLIEKIIVSKKRSRIASYQGPNQFAAPGGVLATDSASNPLEGSSLLSTAQVSTKTLVSFMHLWPYVLSPVSKLQMALDAAEALLYLHSLPSPFIHRDVKSQNFLVTRSYHLKLSDFGEVCSIPRAAGADKGASGDGGVLRHEGQPQEPMTTEVGTTQWMAPEMLRGEEFYGPEVDIYGLGVVLWEIWAELHPFAGLTENKIVYRVVVFKLRPTEPPLCPIELWNLICRCWAHDGAARPTARQVLDELKKIYDDLTRN